MRKKLLSETRARRRVVFQGLKIVYATPEGKAYTAANKALCDADDALQAAQVSESAEELEDAQQAYTEAEKEFDRASEAFIEVKTRILTEMKGE